MTDDTSHPALRPEPTPAALPDDAPARRVLHDEVHARPSPRITLPARVTCVAVLHGGADPAVERAHLRGLVPDLVATPAPFERIALPGEAWLDVERHTEFTRYTLAQPIAGDDGDGDRATPALPGGLAWWRAIPGTVIAAIELVMVVGAIDDVALALARAQRVLGTREVVGSRLGNAAPASADAPSGAQRDAPQAATSARITGIGPTAPPPRGHSVAVTDFRIRADGFERIVVVAPDGTTPTRAGRIAQRLLEIEIYRVMALRGLPVAKDLTPELSAAQAEVAAVTAALEAHEAPAQVLLDRIVHLAARVARAQAEHGYRFSATKAYDTLVGQRIAELRETPIPGTQTIGEFMQRRLSPATATVAATALRMERLTEQIAQASDLIRTRVDIATEAQSHELLARLAKGQDLQLKMQMTVEGLSIAAISYYAVGLVGYGFKALKAAGWKIDTDLAVGLSVPVVVAIVWWLTRRIHHRLQPPGSH